MNDSNFIFLLVISAVLGFIIGLVVNHPHNPDPTQYKIINTQSFSDMEYQVERHMNDGWSLYGELQVQAMMGANGDVELRIWREVRK